MYVIIDISRPTHLCIGPFATLAEAQMHRRVHSQMGHHTAAWICIGMDPPTQRHPGDRAGARITVRTPTANHMHLNGQSAIVDVDGGDWVRVRLGGVNYELDNGELVAPLDAVARTPAVHPVAAAVYAANPAPAYPGCDPDRRCVHGNAWGGPCSHCNGHNQPTNQEACPGCGCMPGDGTTAGCTHPTGCGYYHDLEANA